MSEAIRLLPGEVSQPLEDGLSAQALLLSIRRHWPMVVTLMLLLTIAGALVGLGLPAWYKAEAVVVINSRPHRSADLQELPDPASPELSVIVSETDILQSRSVIEPVVRSFKLWEAPEFQKREYPGGWEWRTVEARLRELLGFANPPEDGQQPSRTSSPPGDANPPTQAQIDWAVEAYANYLNVVTDGRSMTIR